MTLRARLILAMLVLPTLTIGHNAVAQEGNVLAQCRAQTQDMDQVHACLDDYLDVMDGNILAITDYIAGELSGDLLAGLNRSQQAFVEYRRQNCLWYLNFSSPRVEAEQIAKNCLATMSQDRLRELQSLVTADDPSGQTIAGFYVYGPERNSFQPCDSEERYWIEGEPGAVGLIQQSYLSVATNERQLLHAILVGKLNTELQAPEGHQGVLELSNLIELRSPTESDCQLPNRPFSLDISASDVDVTEQTREVQDDEQIEQEEPEQQLRAYFGSWTVDCVEITGRKSCSLEVALTENGPNGRSEVTASSPRLVLNRLPRRSTFMELEFPGREIDSPSLIRWRVDTELFGDIVNSEIRVDQAGARQLISESEFMDDKLLPMMIMGREVIINVLNSVDDEKGDAFFATLNGLTRSLVFADDFVRDSGQ
ncbi:MAG: lysozyme inhibitor LprI family protein [Granulosicoccus sp.]